MTIRPIKTNDDYEAALAEVEHLFEIEKTEEEYDRLDILGTLIEAYEAKHYPIGPPDPVAAIEYEMEKRGLSRRALEPMIGSSGRVSEVLNRQRHLTMAMIRNLNRELGIAADILVAPYPLATDAERKAKQMAPAARLGIKKPRTKANTVPGAGREAPPSFNRV